MEFIINYVNIEVGSSMHFYKRLYMTESLKKKKRQIVWKLKTKKFMPSVYVIVLAESEDLLEIYHSALLKQPYYKYNPPFIVGIAKNYEEAVKLVQEILLDVKQKSGNYDVKAFCSKI